MCLSSTQYTHDYMSCQCLLGVSFFGSVPVLLFFYKISCSILRLLFYKELYSIKNIKLRSSFLVRISSIFLLLAVFLSMMNGIARASLQMKLTPVLREGYDDNLFLSKDEAKKEDDFMHSTGLLFGLDQSSYYLVSLLNYYIDSERYSKNGQLDNVSHNAYLQLDIMPSNAISFDVKNFFKSTEEFDLTDTSTERPFGSIERQKRNVNDLYLRMNYQMTGRSILYFNYKRYLEDVETIKELDEDINSYEIGLDYHHGIMNKNKFSLMFEFKGYTFQENKIEGKDKGFGTYSFMAASLLDISYKSKLTCYGGILMTEDKNKDVLSDEDYFFTGGIAYKTELNYAQINFSYDYEISSSGGFGELVEREGIKFKGTAFINSCLSTTLSSNFRDNNYSESNISDSKNDNNTLSFLLDLSYDNKDKFKTTLYYSFFKNDYLIPEKAGISDYEQSTISLKMTYSFLKYWILKIEYNYTWRDTIGETVSINDRSFKRNLITIGIELNNINFR